MNRIAQATALAALATAGIAAAAPVSTWHGRYVWQESLGRIGGDTPAEGVAAFVTYTLELGPGTGPTGCRLNMEGYQTFRHLRCTATPQGNSLIVKHYAAAPEDTGGSYRVGTSLLTLDRAGERLTTRLEALEPASSASPHAGALFRRVR